MSNQIPYFAISGLKNSGKNTVAEIVCYCLNTPKFMHNYFLFKIFKFFKGKYKIISFAKPMKEMLAILLNVPISLFENRDFKDNTYIYFPTLKIEKNPPPKLCISSNNFNKALANKEFDFIKYNYLTIRQLMQCFATELMRGIFGDKLWTLSTLKRKNLVISDLRFKTEAEEVHKKAGKIIYIKRNSCNFDNHASEREMLEMYATNVYDFVITNNKSKKDLFYSITNII